MSKKAGFTLIELLVVIAIIAVLIALLVPAVQRVREAASRTQCVNNLKQIGLAIHGFHDTHKIIPIGFGDHDEEHGYGWGTFILPYLEQKNLYDKLREAELPDQLGSTTSDCCNPEPDIGNGAARTSLAIYICPSSTLPTHDHRGLARSNYCGNNTDSANQAPGNGFFQGRSEILNFANITDGLSNTIAVGEVERTANVGPSANSSGAFPVWVGGDLVGGDTDSVMRRCDGTNNSLNSVAGNDEAFGSLHPGGANFLFGDGSCHFLSETITPATYVNLGRRNDGNPVTIP